MHALKKAPLALVFVLVLAQGALSAQEFTLYDNFPGPADGAYGVAGAALPDGRLAVWNGGDVFVQPYPGIDRFQLVASGYAGDPGFIALAPDGHTLALGAGYGGQVYLFDLNAPVDGQDNPPAATLSHYGGAFLTENLLLLDISAADWMNSELHLLDLAADKAATVRVVSKPAPPEDAKDLVVNKPGYTSDIYVDRGAGRVYVMDGATGEVRWFTVNALVQAFEGGATLDWAADGALVGGAGTYYTGGVAGINAAGRLIIDGSFGYMQPGGIQLVDPATGSVVETLDPDGTQGYTSVIYNPVTDVMTVFVNGVTFASEAPASLPAAGFAGLVLCGAAIAAAYRRKRG